MQEAYLQLLWCVRCHGDLTSRSSPLPDAATALACTRCGQVYPVSKGIPRLVESSHYAESFGFQWNRFSRLQLDSYNRSGFSEERFRSITSWSPQELRGKTVVDAGCGSGRFAEIVGAKYGARVVAFDLSNAVEACRENLPIDSALVVQASIYDSGLREAAFDYVYSIGVVQHTPDPAAAIVALCRLVRPGGRIGLWIYERNWKLFVGTPLFKYLLRPITSRWTRRRQLAFCKRLVRVCYPIVVLGRRGGLFGKAVTRLLPVAAAHLHDVRLSLADLKTWVLLDTFDMYSPAYDAPLHFSTVVRLLEQEGFDEIRRHPHGAIAVTARRQLERDVDRASSRAGSAVGVS